MKLPKINKIKLAIGFLALIALFVIFYGISAFYETYSVKFQTPIIIQTPVWIEARKPVIKIITPTPTKEPKKTSLVAPAIAYAEPNLSVLAKFIHYRETGYGKATSGHHIYCRNLGMWNEIGYNPQGKFCFNNVQEGFAKLESWLESNVSDLGVAGALCKYNMGGVHKDCQYYQEYLTWSIK